MPLTVVIGAQFGGEGKGKLVSNLSIADDVDIVVRCGGPNSGHTVDYAGFRIGLRMVPAGFVNKRTKLMLAPGALVDPKILFTEMEKCNVDSSRLMIDRNACIVKEDYAELELEQGLRHRVGSTASGTGVGVAKRALRDPDVQLARNADDLARFVGDVSRELNDALDQGKKVIVEGTQGFGLSLYHTDHYPYATSRDTTASGFLSETGLAPTLVDDVIMAVRTFPIRVEGESGPLKDEITWEELRAKSGYPHAILERTTATGRIRRVGKFDMELVRRAAQVNRPTSIALHGVDYLDYRNKGANREDRLSRDTIKFMKYLEDSLRVPVRFVGTGPKNEEMIDRESGDLGWEVPQVRTINQNNQ
jgi:adenylosuccinate synthase